LVRDTYLKNKNKLATQHGTQRHAKPNFNRVRELIRDGAIGELNTVYAWGNRQIRRPGYPTAQGEPPKTLHYDLWIGPSPLHPYNPEYFGGEPGANCLNWNMYWDFGTGQVGDMGSHTMDLVWNAIDAGLPSSAEAEGEKFNPEVTPVELKATFEHPANRWRPPIKVIWYQGGMMPTAPLNSIDLKKIGHGALFKGSQGFLLCDFDTRLIIPYGNNADMTYYQPRRPSELGPPVADFQQEWIDACKGNLKTSCDFEYGANMMEQLLLGLVAYRVGAKLEYDGATGRVTNNSQANDLLVRQYRKGWTLNG
jgi:predicted dehydrogenase